MKQLLLRVDDELHTRLTERARARGISLNALANQILGLEIDSDRLSPRDRVRLQLMTVGVLGRTGDSTAIDLPAVTEAEWRRAVAVHGELTGARDWIDDLISDQRGLS